MYSTGSAPAMSTAGSTASSSGPTTPEPIHDGSEVGGETTPTPTPKGGVRDEQVSRSSMERKEVVDRAKMPPPPVPLPMPVTTVHAPTPPRMTRMPSLSEISSHLHIPSPLSHATPKAPSRPPVLTSPSGTPAAASASGTSPTFAPSPSGRLRLPASAMTRTRSGSGASSSIVPTLTSLTAMTRSVTGTAHVSGAESSFDPGTGSTAATGMERSESLAAAATANMAVGAGASTSGMALDGSIGTLRRQPSRESMRAQVDMPSLATIRQRVNPDKDSVTSASTGGISRVVQTSAEPGETKKGAQLVGNVSTAEADSEEDLELVETLLEDLKIAQPGGGPLYKGATAGHPSSHPLQYPWTLYFDAKSYMPPIEQSAGRNGGRGMGDYEKSLLCVGKIDTVESFARHMNNLRLPSRLKQNSNFHLFKGDIRPMWEDPANSAGGKWVILFRQAPPLLDIAWANLTMALVGQILDPDDLVCGIVASNRPKVDRLQVWTRSREDVEALNAIGRKCLEIMGFDHGEMESVSTEFQYNASNIYPPANTFLHVPFPNRNFYNTPSTPARLGGHGSPALSGPASAGSGGGNTLYLTPSPGGSDPSPLASNASHHPLPMPLNPRAGNLSINVPLPPQGHQPFHSSNSPLSATYHRGENRPISPGITPTPSPKMAHAQHVHGHTLPRPPDSATIKAAMLNTSPLLGGGLSGGGGGSGGTGMRRMGSGQGASAFAGPMSSARSPRMSPADLSGKLAPPSPVPAYGP